jgi:2-octaprenylphenol hydroxylase
MHTPYDIIIIGAGAIGLTQAVALIESGFRVALVDNGPQPTRTLEKEYDQRVFALNRYSQNCLEKWDIWSNIESMRLTEYHQVNLAFSNHQPNLTFYDSDDAETNLGHIVEQSVWRIAALEKLLESDQCDFFWLHELLNIEDSNPLFVKIGGKNTTTTLQAQLLIGADGAQSKVRTLSHIQSDQFPCKQTALIFNIHTERAHSFSAHQYFCEQGIVAFLPLVDDYHFSIVWSMPDELLSLNDLSDAALACELSNICNRKWGALSLVTKRTTFPLVQQQAQSYIAQNRVLIGDAAHTIHPLAGQGANLGIADIDQLTQRLVWAKMHQRPISDSTTLKPYARNRRTAAWKMIGLMAGFQQFSSKLLIINKVLCPLFGVINRLPPMKNLCSRFALYRFTK